MNNDVASKVLDGVLAVPVCPFTENDIDEAGAENLIRRIAISGVDALVPCGNTSEFYSLAPAEIQRFTEIAVSAVAGHVPVIVGVGGDPKSAAQQAKFAETIGADAIMIHEPVAPYVSAEGLVAYFRSIAAGVEIAAFPYIRKDILNSKQFGEVFEATNIVGVKLATSDLDLVAELTKDHPDRVWICGSAELWAPYYRLAGARGFTSGLAGFQPALPLRLRDQLKSGDLLGAMQTWRAIRPFELLRTGKNNSYNVATIKEAMRQLGLQVGPPRLPASPPPAAMSLQIHQILTDWGLLAKDTITHGVSG